MRSPTRRYGNPVELRFWLQGVPIKAAARELMRDEATIRGWLSGRRKVPYWVTELLRLRAWWHEDQARQMGPSVYDAFRLHQVARFEQVATDQVELRTGTNG